MLDVSAGGGFICLGQAARGIFTIMSNITWVDYAIFAVYILLSVGVGIFLSGKQTNLRTFLLAGNQMNPVMIAISIIASLFSGISFLGAPAETYNHNLIYLWTLVAFFVATPITNVIFLPFFYRLNFYTAYEYLEHRFDLRLRRISSASFIFRVCLWLALALYAPSLVISEMIGLPLWTSILFAGGCTALYTIIGGMKAVIYTDVMQFSVLLLGILTILFVALQKTPGGFEGAWQIAEAGGRTKLFDFNFSPEVRMTFWGAFFGGVFAHLSSMVTDQISVQRYLTAKSLKESQRALWLKLALTFPLISIFYLTGIILYSFYQTHPEMLSTLTTSDRLLPHFVSRQIASPVPGLLVAAILSATMATVSSGINSLTTATMIDFIYTKKTENGTELEEHTKVALARKLTFLFAAVATVSALFIGKLGTIIEASVKIGGLFGGPLLGIFCLGVLSRRANAQGTLVGAGMGFCVMLWAGLATHISFMWYAMLGSIATYVTGEIASRFFHPPTEYQQRFSRPGQKALGMYTANDPGKPE